MDKLTAENESNLKLSDAPLVYVDTLVGLAIGPFVSKMILGVENPGQQNSPSLQVTMPTNSLYELAKNIIELLANEDAQKSIAKGHADFQGQLNSSI